MRNLLPWVLGVLVVLFPGSVRATYSIVATDRETGQVGGVGTSCVGSLDVYVICRTVAGHGAVHAQANLNTDGRDRAAELLEVDTPPQEIIDAIASSSFDPSFQSRQYGVVDLSGRSAGFSGTQNGAYSGDVQGEVETFTYSVQGNILTSEAVINQARAGFEGDGCDLADRLMLAIEAGAENGEGDSRCTDQGIPSDSAFIHVVLEDGQEYLHLSVTDTAPASPLVELRQLYDVWREENECPEDDTDSSDDDDDTDSGDDDTDGDDDDDNDNDDNNNDNDDNNNDTSDDDDDSDDDDTGDDDDDNDTDTSGDDDEDDDDNDDELIDDTPDKGCGCGQVGTDRHSPGIPILNLTI